MLHRLVEPSGQLCVSGHDLTLKQVLESAYFPVVEQVGDRNLGSEEFGVLLAQLSVELVQGLNNRVNLKFYRARLNH